MFKVASDLLLSQSQHKEQYERLKQVAAMWAEFLGWWFRIQTVSALSFCLTQVWSFVSWSVITGFFFCCHIE